LMPLWGAAGCRGAAVAIGEALLSVRARLVSPAVLYNATTVASIDYQAHPPNE
jgi:hypothetical protein